MRGEHGDEQHAQTDQNEGQGRNEALTDRRRVWSSGICGHNT